jgi:hypothetical protein
MNPSRNVREEVGPHCSKGLSIYRYMRDSEALSCLLARTAGMARDIQARVILKGMPVRGHYLVHSVFMGILGNREDRTMGGNDTCA